MTIQQLHMLHKAQPFRPFRINMADARHLDVQHPEFLWSTPGGRTVFVAKSDEDVEIVDLLLVTSLQPISPAKKGRNGKHSG
jgi:hypothetical protein